MPAKRWEDDFRMDAITASIALFPREIPEDVHDAGSSFCLPARDRPMVGFTPGKLSLVLLIAGFLLLGIAVFVLAPSDKDANPDDHLSLVASLLVGLTGMMCFFIPAVFDKPIAKMFLGSRGSELQERAGSQKLLSAELANGDPSQQEIAIDADDNVLVFADERGKRLIIEGLAARYHIRQQDVIAVEPFVFTNYIGASIHFRLDEQTSLLIALARVSLLYEVTRQLPFLGFLRKRIKNRILDKVLPAIKPPVLMAEVIEQ